jgi:hypothetical protein
MEWEGLGMLDGRIGDDSVAALLVAVAGESPRTALKSTGNPFFICTITDFSCTICF